MKLTSEQIDQLYTFTIKHYVEYYDLQTELVDHLANAIEQQWQENPKLSFEEALQIEFKKFGIFGFTDMVTQRKRTLQEKYEKIANGYLREFFKLPAIIFTLAILGFTTFSLDQEQRNNVVIGLFIILFWLEIYHWLLKMIKEHRKEKGNDKKWLFEVVLRKHKPLNYFKYFVFISIYSYIFKDRVSFDIPEFFVSIYQSVFILYIVLYIYIMRILIPSKTKQYLKETYPEYELSK